MAVIKWFVTVQGLIITFMSIALNMPAIEVTEVISKCFAIVAEAVVIIMAGVRDIMVMDHVVVVADIMNTMDVDMDVVMGMIVGRSMFAV
jgi:hypothetical protein